MDLCGPMRVESTNGKKSKDEAPDAIIKCIKNIQVRLNATVWNVRTDNGTEIVNQTLREFYENVSISHQTSVARTPQQNDVVERQNWTLVEDARTMLIFSKAPLFLAVDIAGSPSSTTIDQDAPSSSTSSTNQQQQSSIISQGVEEPIPNAHFDDPCHEPLHDVSTSQESSSNAQSSHSPLELIGR
ncbi:retrovirus-related pol polyprotein from transposon TNT 1-94 [Tanacetum coccineum]